MSAAPMPTDILERLRILPTVRLSQSEHIAQDIELASVIRQMMIERGEAATAIEDARNERDELSADLAAIREATRIRPNKKATASLKDLLEAMEAMSEKEAPALRILLDMIDRLERL